MKFYESHFEEYIVSNQKKNLHYTAGSLKGNGNDLIFCEDFTSRIVPLLIFAIMKYVYVTLFLFAFTLTQSQDKLTPETLWKIGRVSDPKLSPDKKTVIYGVKNYDLAANKGTNILYSLNLQNNKNKY